MLTPATSCPLRTVIPPPTKQTLSLPNLVCLTAVCELCAFLFIVHQHACMHVLYSRVRVIVRTQA